MVIIAIGSINMKLMSPVVKNAILYNHSLRYEVSSPVKFVTCARCLERAGFEKRSNLPVFSELVDFIRPRPW